MHSFYMYITFSFFIIVLHGTLSVSGAQTCRYIITVPYMISSPTTIKCGIYVYIAPLNSFSRNSRKLRHIIAVWKKCKIKYPTGRRAGIIYIIFSLFSGLNSSALSSTIFISAHGWGRSHGLPNNYADETAFPSWKCFGMADSNLSHLTFYVIFALYEPYGILVYVSWIRSKRKWSA